MNTFDRAAALASLARQFPILGQYDASDLLDWVRLELGHAEILDGFRPYGAHFAKAAPRSPLLHIVSGNTPHAALQSLQRGLLLGARNHLKLPSSGLPEVEDYVARLPEPLRALVSVSRELSAEWIRSAQAWIVFGSDETIAHFRRQAPPSVPFDAHGHLFSFGLVFAEGVRSASLAARDISRFNQKGCLSPHNIFVAEDPRAYAAALAEEMAAYAKIDPPLPLTTAEAAEIHNLRANYRFRAAGDSRVQVWESSGSLDWTVIYEDDPWFAPSPLNRFVFVKPLPADPHLGLGPVLGWLGAIGIWPATPAFVARVEDLQPSRICALGRMQDPSLTWHQEGRATLAPLVRWLDFEAALP